MQLAIEGIAVEGFKSFRGDAVLRFNGRPGLYLMSGENGAGKSTVWDALIWAFYGKTSRGVRGKHLQNWDVTDEVLCSVVAAFSLNDVSYNLTRTWSPNSLSLQIEEADPKAVTQEEVDELLGLDYDTFLSTIVFAQMPRPSESGQYFFDLSPAEKLKRFTHALDLDFWIACSKMAVESTNKCETDLQEAQEQKARTDGKLEKTRSEIVDLEARQVTWKAEEKERKKARADRVREIEVKLDEAQNLRASWETEHIRVRAEQDRWEGERVRVTDPGLSEEWAGARKDVQRFEEEVRELRNRIKAAEALEGECPVCLADVTEERAALIASRLREDLQSARRSKCGADELAGEIEKRIRFRQEQLDKANEILTELRTKERAAVRQVSDWTSKAADLKGELKHLDTGPVLKDPYAEPLESLRNEEKDLAGAVQGLKAEASRLRIRAEGIRQWIKGFMELRLWLVEQALTELEVVTNNSLYELGLPEWRVHFDVERETQTGTIARGFQVFIHPPGKEDPVPWECWSGGETQRLRLAGNLGLSALLCARRGIRCNLLVLDEPTTHLNQEGVEALLGLLRNMAIQEQKLVWLIDHRSLFAGDFEDEIHVIKEEDGNGSRIVTFRR